VQYATWTALRVCMGQPYRNWKGRMEFSHYHREEGWKKTWSWTSGELWAVKGVFFTLGAVYPITAAWSRWEGWAACNSRILGQQWCVWMVHPSVSDILQVCILGVLSYNVISPSSLCDIPHYNCFTDKEAQVQEPVALSDKASPCSVHTLCAVLSTVINS
jgi:hypothetical protein